MDGNQCEEHITTSEKMKVLEKVDRVFYKLVESADVSTKSPFHILIHFWYTPNLAGFAKT